MKSTIVKCVLSTEYFKRGKTAVAQKVLRFLKTGSHIGSYETVQLHIKECPTSFFEEIENFNETPDGYYDLIVKWYEGSYEYPSEGYVEYRLACKTGAIKNDHP